MVWKLRLGLTAQRLGRSPRLLVEPLRVTIVPMAIGWPIGTRTAS